MVADDLVERMSVIIDEYSAEQHDLARKLGAVRRARTDLRLGRSPAVVLPLLEDELGEPVDMLLALTR
jgi:hypothetical protein